MDIAVLERPRVLTAAEYLRRERSSEHKHEYFQGEIAPMTGASRKHNLIVANLLINLGVQLIDSDCKVYPSDMRVKVGSSDLYTYPDVSVVCDPPVFEDDHVDTLLNPTVIVEVLSASTQSYDRGRKFGAYRTLRSLQDYLLVEQDEILVEHYTHQFDGSWRFVEANTLTDRIILESIGCQLTLYEIYRKVQDLLYP